MSKTEFTAPRFCGKRFDEHTLPLELAEDLVAYQKLVVELAKHLFIRQNTDRQRVPKGFGKDFHLHIERIEAGSAQPVLALVSPESLGLGDGEHHFFEAARDLVARCIAAVGGALPEEFPRELLTHFNKLGRSLREGESIEFPVDQASAGAAGSLTPPRRRSLVLAASRFYEREIELEGTVGEADWEKSTFRLRLDDGTTVTVPMETGFHESAGRCGGRVRHLARVRGVASFDASDRLQKITQVDELEAAWNYEIAVKFEALADLPDGWFDGCAGPLPKEALEQVAAAFVHHHPDSLPVPAIVPTPEGGLLVEWSDPLDPSLDIDLSTLHGELHLLRPFESDLEEDFDFNREGEWGRLFETLAREIA